MVLRDATGAAFATAVGGHVRFTDAATAARSVAEIRRRGFRWAALFTVGRESPRLWRLLPASVGRPATPR